MRYPLPDYYAILSVGRDASRRDIVSAYRREVRLCHPDLHALRADDARIREVNQAYEVLGDERRRAEYDRELARRERAGVVRFTPRGPVGSPEYGWGRARRFSVSNDLAAAALAELLELLDAFFGGEDLRWRQAYARQLEWLAARRRTWRIFDLF